MFRFFKSPGENSKKGAVEEIATVESNLFLCNHKYNNGTYKSVAGCIQQM